MLATQIYKLTEVTSRPSVRWNKETQAREPSTDYDIKGRMAYKFDGLRWIPVKKAKEQRLHWHEYNPNTIITQEVIKTHIQNLNEQIKFLESLNALVE